MVIYPRKGHKRWSDLVYGMYFVMEQNDSTKQHRLTILRAGVHGQRSFLVTRSLNAIASLVLGTRPQRALLLSVEESYIPSAQTIADRLHSRSRN